MIQFDPLRVLGEDRDGKLGVNHNVGDGFELGLVDILEPADEEDHSHA